MKRKIWIGLILIGLVLLVGCGEQPNTTLHTATLPQIVGTQTDVQNNAPIELSEF